MGTFMRTGLINEFSVDKLYKKPRSFSPNDFRVAVEKAVVNNPEIYDCEEKKETYVWTLQRELRKKHIVDLLRRYYGDFYDLHSDYFAKNCKPAIEYLSHNPSDEELAYWAEENYLLRKMVGWSRTVTIDRNEVEVYFSFLDLSYEGKVSFEQLELHLAFFEKAIRRIYADNPLGGCLVVDMG